MHCIFCIIWPSLLSADAGYYGIARPDSWSYSFFLTISLLCPLSPLPHTRMTFGSSRGSIYQEGRSGLKLALAPLPLLRSWLCAHGRHPPIGEPLRQHLPWGARPRQTLGRHAGRVVMINLDGGSHHCRPVLEAGSSRQRGMDPFSRNRSNRRWRPATGGRGLCRAIALVRPQAMLLGGPMGLAAMRAMIAQAQDRWALVSRSN